MAYKRKTHDEWQIWGDFGYGGGYEYVVTAEDRDDARRLLKEYRENDRGSSYCIKMARVPN